MNRKVLFGILVMLFIQFVLPAEAAEQLTMRERVIAILSDSPWSGYYKGPKSQSIDAAMPQEEATLPDEAGELAEPEQEENDVVDVTAGLRRLLEQRMEEKAKAVKTDIKAAQEAAPVKEASPVRPQRLRASTPVIIEDESLSPAEEEPDACVYFDYRSGTVNSIYGLPDYITDIVLQPGETLRRISIGDRQRWRVETFYDDVKEQHHIYLRPLQEGIESNMIIATDKHQYQLKLATSIFYNPIVAWKYPGEGKYIPKPEKPLTMEVSSVDKLNFGYSVSKKHNYSWQPRHVFDDGFNTYISIDPDEFDSINPVIFTKNRIGNIVLVDYEKINGNIVIRDIYDNLELRVRDEAVNIKKQI